MSSILSSLTNMAQSCKSAVFNAGDKAYNYVSHSAAEAVDSVYEKASEVARDIKIQTYQKSIQVLDQLDHSISDVSRKTKVLTSQSPAPLPDLEERLEHYQDAMQTAIELKEIGDAQSASALAKRRFDLKGRVCAQVAAKTYPLLHKATVHCYKAAFHHRHKLKNAVSLAIHAPHHLARGCGLTEQGALATQLACQVIVVLGAIYFCSLHCPDLLGKIGAMMSSYLSHQKGVLMQDALVFFMLVYAAWKVGGFVSSSTKAQIRQLNSLQQTLQKQAVHFNSQLPLYKAPHGTLTLFLGAGACALFNIAYQSYDKGFGTSEFLQADIRAMALLSFSILASHPQAFANILQKSSKVLTLPKETLRMVQTAKYLIRDDATPRLIHAHSKIEDNPDRKAYFSKAVQFTSQSINSLNDIYLLGSQFGFIQDGPSPLGDVLQNASDRLTLIKNAIVAATAKKILELGLKKIVFEGIVLPKAFDLTLDYLIASFFPQAGFVPATLQTLKSVGSWYAYGMLMNQILESLKPKTLSTQVLSSSLVSYGLSDRKKQLVNHSIEVLKRGLSVEGIFPLIRLHYVIGSSAEIFYARNIISKELHHKVLATAKDIHKLHLFLMMLPQIQVALRSTRSLQNANLQKLLHPEAAHLESDEDSSAESSSTEDHDGSSSGESDIKGFRRSSRVTNFFHASSLNETSNVHELLHDPQQQSRNQQFLNGLYRSIIHIHSKTDYKTSSD